MQQISKSGLMKCVQESVSVQVSSQPEGTAVSVAVPLGSSALLGAVLGLNEILPIPNPDRKAMPFAFKKLTVSAGADNALVLRFSSINSLSVRTTSEKLPAAVVESVVKYLWFLKTVQAVVSDVQLELVD